MHRIIETDEAHWSPAEKVWAGVQQFDPRRGSKSIHIIILAAAVALTIGLIIGTHA